MKPLLWLAIGGAGAAVLLLVTRKAQAQTPPPLQPPTSPIYGEQTKVSLAVPTGWRRVTSAEVTALPELGTQANLLRNSPGFTDLAYGTLTPFVASDGNTYATWVEQHYHPPGGALKPWGLHHGVTLLAQVSSSTLSDEWQGVRSPC